MMQKIQRFGGAMFTPVLLLAFSGIVIGISTLFTSESVFGPWVADENGAWFKCWNLLSKGGWTIFNQMPLIFVVGLPVGLAKKQQGRCCLEAILLFLTFHYFLSTILSQWGNFFGVEYSETVEEGSKLALVANIPTLDMGIAGALLVSGIVVWIHNRFFDAKLPTWLNAFSGSAFVCMIGFFVMIPVAFLAALIWPHIQDGIDIISRLLSQAGPIGVWFYTFLEKALLPFGLHHLLYFPIYYDNILVDGGTYAQWLQDLPNLAASTEPLRDLAPYSAFQMTALSSIFGAPGIALAFYFTAKKSNRKKLLALLIPLVFTASFCAITEPIEFTFLFIAPPLFIVHAILGACLTTTAYLCGIVGSMAGNFFEQLAINYIPLWPAHGTQYLILLLIGVCYTAIYFFVFRFLIKKFDFKTPGRKSDDEIIRFNTKSEYREKKALKKSEKNSSDGDKAQTTEMTLEEKILEAVGGKENVKDVTNCATRLRLNVNDSSKVKDDTDFKAIGTHGAKKSGNSVQVIIGLDVPNVREKFEKLLEE